MTRHGQNRGLRNSTTMKSLGFMVLFATCVMICLELLGMNSMRNFEERTFENYRKSLESYCEYWDNKLHGINSVLVQHTSVNTRDLSYWNICTTQDSLELETSKVLLRNSLSELARNNQNQFLVFAAVPQRNIYIQSTNTFVSYDQRSLLISDIQNYMENRKTGNSTMWKCIISSGRNYLINGFNIYNGYIGAIVDFESIAKGLLTDDTIINASIKLENGTVYDLSNRANLLSTLRTEPVLINMPHVYGKLQLDIQKNLLVANNQTLLLVSLLTAIVGLVIMVLNASYQMVHIVRPINQIKDTMNQFSQGELDTRLDIEALNAKGEIHALACSFNDMAEQIQQLKIEVYESELTHARTYSNYMRLRIQPHFYTNILNLIHGLAEMKDYVAIQKLAMYTGSYFRYLLGEKAMFVLLKNEVECVQNYIEIQRMRYGDCLAYESDIARNTDDLPVLPLLLQTFVENAVKHNVTMVPLLTVKLTIKLVGNVLDIEIADNGVGFSPDVLQKLDGGESLEQDGHRIGIQNVIERISLFYGEKVMTEIHSEPGNTLVKLLLPTEVQEG